MSDTSAKAVERLDAEINLLATRHDSVLNMLRALLARAERAEAERDRLREALREIMAHIASARGGLTYTECDIRDATHAALKGTEHD